MIKDTYKEDMEERFVQLQMICQEQEEKLEWQEGRIKHLEKFLQLSDESVARCQTSLWHALSRTLADSRRLWPMQTAVLNDTMRSHAR